MLTFGKRDTQGRHVSLCGKYFIQRTDDGIGERWIACEFESDGKFKLLGRDLDLDEARWACEDDKYREACGCVLANRPDWWEHCPKCGAKLEPRRPETPPPPKVKRKKKLPNRPAWLARRTVGTEHGHEWDCVYDGKKWALVRIPGYTGWVSLGSSTYGPTTYEVMRRQEGSGMHINVDETKGVTSLLDVPRFAKAPEEFSSLTVHEGRAKADDRARFCNMVDELDREGL